MNFPSYPPQQVWTDDMEVWAEAASLFLDDLHDDLDDARSGGSDHTTDPDTDSPTAHVKRELELDYPAGAPPPPTKTRRVNRRREEILFLRDQAQQLEQRLLASRQRMEEGMALERELQPTERELLAAAWSTIAAQQRDQRAQSEAEHSRLLQLLDEQRQLARALQRYARRHAVHEIPAPLAVYAQLQPQPADAQSLTAPASFEELERALQSMHEQRDAVLRDARFDDVLSTLRTSRVVNEDTPRACIEMLDARVLPFDVATTANALWQSMVHRVAATVAYNDEKFELHHDVIKKSFIAALDLPLFQASVRARVVVRRLVEAERVVILRATHFEPIGLAGSDIDPFSVRHYQWTSIEAPHHERLRRNRHATAQIQSLDLSFPTLPPTQPHSLKEKTVLQFCETAVAYHLDLSRQSVENLLVSGAVGINDARQVPMAHQQPQPQPQPQPQQQQEQHGGVIKLEAF